MALRNFIRRFVPQRFLEWFRKRKRKHVRNSIESQRVSGSGFTREMLIEQLRAMGISSGDDILVHSSLSRMGFIEGGPVTVIEALLTGVSPHGNVLMPTSPNNGLQLDYVKNLEVFDVLHTPSGLGLISETFRRDPRSERSFSPTEPVSCIGNDAVFYTSGQKGRETPYDDASAFYKLAKKGGKIMYVGCTLDNAGTSLHLLEDAVPDFKFPVYLDEKFEVSIRDGNGNLTRHYIKVHNPQMSARRKCDELIPLFEKEGIVKRVQFGNAPTLLFDAGRMFDFMIRAYNEKGVTMYTPYGS